MDEAFLSVCYLFWRHLHSTGTLCSAPTPSEAPIEKKGKKEKKTKKGQHKGVKKEKKRGKRERIVRL
jgi:hypothetical protein